MLNRRRPRFEPLEDRRLLAVVTVDTLADSIDFADGFTSLREAVFATNLVPGPDTIQFAPTLSAGGAARVVLARGELQIADHLTINGPGAQLLAIDAGGSDPTPDQDNGDGSRVLSIDDGDDVALIGVTLAGLTFTGGDARGSGGAILNHENLTLIGSTVSGNSAVSGELAVLSQGGGIAHSGGALVVRASIVANNAADLGGGIHVGDGALSIAISVVAENVGVSGAGIYNAGGDASVRSSSIRDNSAGAFSLGGGIYNSGDMRIESTTISGNSSAFGAGVFSRTDPSGTEVTSIVNSTISGNTAFTRGGGVRNAAGRTVIAYSTITGNQAPAADGSGVASRGYAQTHTEIRSAIIAGNSNSDVDFGTGSLNTFQSRGYNVIGSGNALAEFHAAGDQTGVTDLLLGPLADNGGPTLPDGSKLLSRALLPGSPAINAGDFNLQAGVEGVPLYDQRGEPLARIVNGRIDIGAYEFQEPSDLNLLVDTLADESDGNYGRGDLSLREAIELANTWPSSDTIRFDPALTASGSAMILLTLDELKITDGLTIEGPGAELLTIDASGNDPTPDIDDGKGSRVFHVDDGQSSDTDVSFSGLTLTGGDTRIGAGAILNFEQLIIVECAIVGNCAYLSSAGGIASNGLSLIVIRSLISGNSATGTGSGGGVAFFGDASFIDCTISNNICAQNGGAISFVTSRFGLEIAGCTFSGNVAGGKGGALFISSTFVGGAFAEITNSTITGNTAGDRGGAAYLRKTSLRLSDCTIADNKAVDRGGGIWFYGDSGFQVTPAEISRSTISGNTAGASGGGLFGYGFSPIRFFDVTITNNVANKSGGGMAVRFADVVLKSSTISGNIASVDGGGVYVRENHFVGMHINVVGNSADDDAGGIFAQEAQLTLEHSAISDNSSEDRGGGIYTADCSLSVRTSAIHENNAAAGAGIFNLTGTGGYASELVQATISGNTARDYGGGVVHYYGHRLSVEYSTITANSAPTSGGLFFRSFPANGVSIYSSIIAGNVNQDVNGPSSTFQSGGFNLIGVGTAVDGFIQSSDQTGVTDPLLGPLTDNGGPTMTHALLPGSPALNAGDPAAMAGAGDVPVNDQRGMPFTRVFNGWIDIGAFEAQPNPLAGDYTFDNVVDAADYVQWRNARGSTTDLRADGNGDGIVNDADRAVWMANFGRTAMAVGQGVVSETEAPSTAAGAPPATSSVVIGSWSATERFIAEQGRRAVGSWLTSIRSTYDISQSGKALLAVPLTSHVAADTADGVAIDASTTSRSSDKDQPSSHARLFDHIFEALGATEAL